jgi:O-acetyl-ADP-ribose deacetylase (regulator of RNase III)
MIRVVLGDPENQRTEAVLRPVTSVFDGTSAASRRLEDGAGASVRTRLDQVGDVPPGAAVITPGGDLPFSFLIHAVIQSPDEPVSEHAVRNALVNGLRRADEWGVESLTVLPFGVGAGNLDADDAARVAVQVLQEHLFRADTLEEIVIAVPSEYLAEAFQTCLARLPGENGAVE